MLHTALREISQSQIVNNELEKAVTRYCLGLDNKDHMRHVAKNLGLLRPLLDVKKNKLDLAAYLQLDLRRALVDYHAHGTTVRDLLEKHQIQLDDLSLCAKYTSWRDLPVLRAKDRVIATRERLEELMTKHIIGYCKMIANRKLKFLYHQPEWKDDYEGVYDKPANYYSPLVAELLAAAWKSTHRCLNTSVNESMLIAQLKNSVRNHAVNLISQFTTVGRAALVRTSKGINGKSFDQFGAVVTSMQAELNSTKRDDNSFTLQDILHGNYIVNSIETLKDFELSIPMYKYSELMLGVQDTNFTNWLQDFTETDESSLDDETLEHMVSLYTGMTQNDKDSLYQILSAK